MNKQTLPMQGRLPDFLRMQASRDSKPVRENLMSQAADALEAQEKRIAELEGALSRVSVALERIRYANGIEYGPAGCSACRDNVQNGHSSCSYWSENAKRAVDAGVIEPVYNGGWTWERVLGGQR